MISLMVRKQEVLRAKVVVYVLLDGSWGVVDISFVFKAGDLFEAFEFCSFINFIIESMTFHDQRYPA